MPSAFAGTIFMFCFFRKKNCLSQPILWNPSITNKFLYVFDVFGLTTFCCRKNFGNNRIQATTFLAHLHRDKIMLIRIVKKQYNLVLIYIVKEEYNLDVEANILFRSTCK